MTYASNAQQEPVQPLPDEGSISGSTSLLRQILRVRLRCYASETLNALRRSWQLVVFVIALVPQLLTSKELTLPITALGASQNLNFVAIASIASIYATSILLVMVQRTAIIGGLFGTYLRALPIPPQIEWHAGLAVLLVADSLLWIYLALALIQADGSDAAPMLLSAQLFFLASSVLLAQRLALLEQVSTAVMLAVSAILVLGAITWLPNSAAALISFLLGAACTAPLLDFRLVNRLLNKSRTYNKPKLLHQKTLSSMRMIRRQAPTCHLVMTNLLGARRTHTLSRLLLSIFWSWFAAQALSHEMSSDVAIGLIVLTTSFSALALIGIFRGLAKDRQHFAVYFSSLPIHRWHWAIPEFSCVAFVSATTLAPFYWYFVSNKFLPLSMALATAISYPVLLATLRAIAVRIKRHSLLLDFAAALLWAAFLLVVNQEI